jgi:hypothetical protein
MPERDRVHITPKGYAEMTKDQIRFLEHALSFQDIWERPWPPAAKRKSKGKQLEQAK